MGDMTTAAGLFERETKVEWAKSTVHWDLTMNQPMVLLDDKVILQNGRLFL
jgi:hypothetical protein